MVEDHKEQLFESPSWIVSSTGRRNTCIKPFRDIDSVLEKAEMGKENIIALRFFTTDIDGFLANYTNPAR
jgi:hypothetical protein